MISVFPDFRGEPDEVRDLGDVTVVRGRLRGHGTESDASFEQTFWQVVKWRIVVALILFAIVGARVAVGSTGGSAAGSSL